MAHPQQSPQERPVRAVVFDLWLTLVPLPAAVRAAAFDSVCSALGMSPSDLEPVWRRRRTERETTDLRRHLQNVAREFDASWDDETLDAAIEARSQTLAVCFRAPLADGAAAITALRERGLGIGLISNCSSDVRTALHDHGIAGWFDTIVLSAEVGVMKPAPEIYLAATEHLGVEPRHCLYVGDGSDDELDGAAAAGMTPIRYDPTGTRHASTITSHLQLIELVEAASRA